MKLQNMFKRCPWCYHVVIRENANAQAASTDGRATLYANGQAHMFERKRCNQKQRGGLNIQKQNHLFFLFLPKAVFEHVYISSLPHSCTVVKQYKESTTKILSITFFILAFLTINPSDHGPVNLLLSLVVISQLLIKLFSPQS